MTSSDDPDRLRDVIKMGEDIVNAVPGKVVRETYNRFALQWLSRIEFDEGVKPEPIQVNEPLTYKLVKLCTGTAMMAIKDEAEIRHSGLMKFIATAAREKGLFDTFDGEIVKKKFVMLGGWISSAYVSFLGIAPRTYDIRIILQMACPKLWKASRFDDFINKNDAEEIKILGIQRRAMDEKGNCEFIPATAKREIKKYIEEHMVKSSLNSEFTDVIDKSMAEFLSINI